MVLELRVENVGFAYGDRSVLRDVTLPTMRTGQVTGLIGPNATGKSTLLRCIAGIQRCTGNLVLTDGESGTKVESGTKGSDGIVYVPQDLPPASSITVFDAVLLACQQNRPLRPSRAVIDRVGRTLAWLRLDGLAGTAISDLSGGQRQMVSLAQALARRPAVLLLDEPTSNLDLRNQLEILELVRSIATEQPAVVLLTIHDLALAARFTDQIAVLHGGGVYSSGSPEAVITEPMLREVYQVDASVHHAPDGSLSLAAARGL